MADLSAAWLAELTRFDPPKTLAAPPDWDEAVQVLAHHGLGPIAAYNLQYRMPGADAPDYAKDLLLGFFQGASGDNVFKFVTIKSSIGSLEGVHVVLLDSVAFADQLYPHVAFRPIPDLRLLVRPQDVPVLVEAMREEKFVEVESDEPDPDQPAVVLYNDRFYARLYTSILPNEREVSGLFERAVPAKVLGPAVSRLSAEDALLVHVLSLARRGFAVPLIQLVDLREMVQGEAPAAFRGGPGAKVDPVLLKQRAKAFGVENALWAAMEVLAFFHPAVAAQARALQPDVNFATRKLLETAVVQPAHDFMRERQLKVTAKLQQLLIG